MELLVKRVSGNGLPMKSGHLATETILAAANNVNQKLRDAVNGDLGVNLDLYEIIDLRMLSGMIGEMFTSEVTTIEERVIKNPNIDGYPDLCDVSHKDQSEKIKQFSIDKFLDYEHGGFEVKNTFGVKKSKKHLAARESRINAIQKRLVWKAHHRETNHLIALQSDYVKKIPQIVACFYSDQLCKDDWTEKQQPKSGSTMTSFSQTTKSAYDKLKSGIIFCAKEGNYEDFIRN